MNKPYTIIQCLNYFEYMNFKDRFDYMYFNYSDATYTFKLFDRYDTRFLLYLLKQHIPTAIITQVSFRNGRTIYTKLKD